MKKIIAILLALALSLSTAFAAEINWADYSDAASALDPNAQVWTLNGVNVSIWVPAKLEYIELEQDDIDAGYLAYWQTEDGAAAMAVQYADMSGMSLADYGATLTEMGVADLQEHTVNGIPCLTYSWTNDEGVTSNVVAFTTVEGHVVEFSFTAGDEGYEQVSALIAASLQIVQ